MILRLMCVWLVFYSLLSSLMHGTMNLKLRNVSAKTHPLSCKVFFAFGDCSSLAYDAVLIGNLLRTCQRSLMPPPSGQLNKSKILGEMVAALYIYIYTVQQREFVKVTAVLSQQEELLRQCKGNGAMGRKCK
jgi:hypothetical protein